MKRFRVIAGGKSKPGPPEDSQPCLYRAHSMGTYVKGEATFEDVVFHWYCLDRDGSPVSYGMAIAGYESMDPELRRPFERFVDRHFTESEIEALEDYLSQKYGLELFCERIGLPVKDRAFLFEEGSEVIYEFIELSERPDYSLPFKVWGYFTLQGLTPQPMFEDGIEFVEELLRQLRLAPPVDRDRLEVILKDVYKNRGLVVRKIEKEEKN
ncbi:MAG: hypothetical protein AB9873_07000 [Syntrophobacteraceae bacterium]